jgi:hypothetical protein
VRILEGLLRLQYEDVLAEVIADAVERMASKQIAALNK